MACPYGKETCSDRCLMWSDQHEGCRFRICTAENPHSINEDRTRPVVHPDATVIEGLATEYRCPHCGIEFVEPFGGVVGED